MMQIITLDEDEEIDIDSMERDGGMDPEVVEAVSQIIADVRERGDEAVADYSAKFDKVRLASFRVSDQILDEAESYLEPQVVQAMQSAYESISSFHKNDVPRSTFNIQNEGTMVGYRVTPLASVGLYIPGGRAAYPSTVLMNGIPAKMAGVKRLVMVTPPSPDGTIDPSLLYAAKLAGVDDVYAVGGAQAIAALAYGTESIPKVDKIVGPGNVYVAAAKALVSGTVGIDLQAGPSEILVLADDTSVPSFVAADLISQAEHDPNAQCYLVMAGDYILNDVIAELEAMTATAPRAEIIRRSLEDNGLIVVCPNMQAAIDTANDIAPEHLEIMVDEPTEVLGQIYNAGAIFVGPWSPVAMGDYIAGPSHTLPTSGTARFSNPLTTDDFVKKSSVISYSFAALERDAKAVMDFATKEGFAGHARSVQERLDFVNGTNIAASIGSAE